MHRAAIAPSTIATRRRERSNRESVIAEAVGPSIAAPTRLRVKLGRELTLMRGRSPQDRFDPAGQSYGPTSRETENSWKLTSRFQPSVIEFRSSSAARSSVTSRTKSTERSASMRVPAGAYSTDASNYRQVPIGVVIPRTVDAGARAVEICHRHDAPVLSRGGGTSLAGECTNTAVVIDWSKYCRRLISVDPDRRTCVVEPGIVLDHLNDSLQQYDLEFGPRPATHSHCTIGGMVGNNSCGATAQRTGKTVDNVVRLEILLYDGSRMWVGETPDDEYARIAGRGGRWAEVYAALRGLRDRNAAEINRRFPDIPRRVSGYNLDSLSREKGFQVAQALVGSEGTLATVLHAELKLVPRA